MRNYGFTLIELLVVVVIMGVLTAVALPQYRTAVDRSKTAEAMQMLPAIFEARERWMIENQYHWASGQAQDSSNQVVVPTFQMLDIEAKGTPGNNSTFITENFTYYLLGAVGTSGFAQNQPCVYAVPQWGGDRGLGNATIFYRGDKFTCSGGESGEAVCHRLNFQDVDGCR